MPQRTEATGEGVSGVGGVNRLRRLCHFLIILQPVTIKMFLMAGVCE